MSTINDGGAAFPEAGLSGLPNGEFLHGRAGMTLRDYFAAKALQGWIATYGDNKHPVSSGNADLVAWQAYMMADAMIGARGE